MAVHALRNPVKHYAWGSRTALPELLGLASPAGEPWAELWIGAHARGTSEIRIGGDWHPLRAWIAADPARALGPAAALRSGGELPFLLKVLAIERPLSLQVHPDADRAAAGYAREEAAGLPLDAPTRSYPDAHPKPELVCALGPFEALCGLRPGHDVDASLRALGAGKLRALLAPALGSGRPRDVLAALLGAPEPARGDALAELGARARARGDGDPALAWIPRLADLHPGDPGIAGPMLLHYVHLARGEALFLRPGILHGYLRGLALELQASSDNVLRGALTRKHVDVAELLASLAPGPQLPDRPAAEARGDATRAYAPRGLPFVLLAERVGAEPVERMCAGPELLLCSEGHVEVGCGDRASLRLRRGEAAFVTGDTARLRLRGEGTLHRAVGQDPARR